MSRRARIALIVAALCVIAGVWLVWPAQAPQFADVQSSYVPSDAFLLDRSGALIDSVRIDMKVRRFVWQPLGGISPALVTAVVQGEDSRFWQHEGID